MVDFLLILIFCLFLCFIVFFLSFLFLVFLSFFSFVVKATHPSVVVREQKKDKTKKQQLLTLLKFQCILEFLDEFHRSRGRPLAVVLVFAFFFSSVLANFVQQRNSTKCHDKKFVVFELTFLYNKNFFMSRPHGQLGYNCNFKPLDPPPHLHQISFAQHLQKQAQPIPGILYNFFRFWANTQPDQAPQKLFIRRCKPFHEFPPRRGCRPFFEEMIADRQS
jgi:hypothetical protein